MENAVGGRLAGGPSIWQRLTSAELRSRVYRLALERGFLDVVLADYVVRPFVRSFQWCDAMERRWTALLAGDRSRDADRSKTLGGVADELL
jgi:NAD(P)H-quinone oxidoreductase subunit 5